MDDKNKKKKNIILGSVLGLAAVGLVIFILFSKGVIGPKPEEPVVGSDPMIVQKDAVARAADPIMEMQILLIKGKHFIGTTSSSNSSVDFEFRDNGTFKGYTKQEFDDLGTWEIEADDKGTYVVINTINTTDRYMIGYNNNKDITLTDSEDKTYVLTEKK